MVVKHSYQALEPDELTLDNGDVVNVLRKMKDDGKLSSLFSYLKYSKFHLHRLVFRRENSRRHPRMVPRKLRGRSSLITRQSKKLKAASSPPIVHCHIFGVAEGARLKKEITCARWHTTVLKGVLKAAVKHHHLSTIFGLPPYT